jgi:transcriptional regulator with XRE-family HTH domain
VVVKKKSVVKVPYLKFAKKVQEALASSGKTKLALSKETSISRPTLDALLSGKSVFRVDQLLNFAKATKRNANFFCEVE